MQPTSYNGVIDDYLLSQTQLLHYKLIRVIQFLSLTVGCITTFWYQQAIYVGIAGYYFLQFIIFGLKPHKQMQLVVRKLLSVENKISRGSRGC
jgi:hypothetical protein